MSRTQRFLATAGVMALLGVTISAQAPQRPMGPPGPEGPRRPGGGFLAGVNLTDAQRDQIRALREEDRTAAGDQMRQLREAQKALHDEIFADNPDPSKIDGLQQQVTSLSQQLQVRRLELQQRTAQVLTPEQRRFVREHRGEMRAFRAGRMMERRTMQRRMLRPRAPAGVF